MIVTELEYFDDIADIMESEEDITSEDLFHLLQPASSGDLHDLIDNYFEDVLKGVPDDATDFYTLMTTIRQYLTNITQSGDDLRRNLADELLRFRTWFFTEPKVRVTDASDQETVETVSEALALHRMELIGSESYQFDFSDALDFPIDDYAMNVLIDREEEECDCCDDDCCDDDCCDDECDCGEHHHHHHESSLHGTDDDDEETIFDDHGWNTLIDKKNPVIDGEFSDRDIDYSKF